MRITIKDIARETGLSPTAVSLVLNDRPNKLSAESRELILETAKRLNYFPNQLAVGLVTRKTHTLGLIIPDIANQYYATLASGIDEEARRHGWNILFNSTNDRWENDLASMHLLASRGADALILAVASDITAQGRAAYRAFIQQSNIPVILVNHDEPSFRCSTVKLDNKAGAYYAVMHLLELGHRDISYITSDEDLHEPTERIAGAMQACEEFGVPFRRECIRSGHYTTKGGALAAEELLAHPTTAIFCFNDMMAFGAFQALRKRKLRIPENISLVGFDDVPFSELLDVPLTTVKQPAYEIGRETVRVALAEIKNRKRPRQNIQFEPELIVRESTLSLAETTAYQAE